MYYAYYNPENMKITGLSNTLDNSRPFLEIDETTYIEFVSGKKNMRNYRVVSTPTTKKLIPKKIDDNNFDISKSVHEFKKVYSHDQFEFKENVLYIIQDKLDNTWKGKLVPNGIENNLSHIFSNNKQIYITEINNPNILLDTIKIDMVKFLSGDEFVVFNKEVDNDVSLFSQIQLEDFIHLVRNYEN